MFLLTLQNRKDDGAYAVQDHQGDKVLFMFEEEDDATRYALMLEDNEMYEKPMQVIEIDEELALKTCMVYNYQYAVISPEDIVIPPNDDNIQNNYMEKFSIYW